MHPAPLFAPAGPPTIPSAVEVSAADTWGGARLSYVLRASQAESAFGKVYYARPTKPMTAKLLE